MKTLGLSLALCALLGLAACGDKASYDSASGASPIALTGAGWEGTPVDPLQSSDKVRVVAFFKPG